MILKTKGSFIVISITILISAGIFILVSKAPGETLSQEVISAPQSGFFAPDFTLQTAEGATITLSELRGKPLLINFWASWCPPCRAEMPALQEIYEANKENDFVVLGINTTYQDDPVQAIAFTEELGLTFPILFDQDGVVSRLYQSRALPTSYFVDSSGVIQEVVVGGPMSDTLLKIRVEELLNSN